MLGGRNSSPSSVLLSLAEITGVIPVAAQAREARLSSWLCSPLLHQHEEVLFELGCLPSLGAVGSWPCHRGSPGGVLAKGLLPAQTQPAQPRLGDVPGARAVGRAEIQLVLLISGVAGLAGVRPSAAALGNFCFRTKPFCWLRELEPCQGGLLKDFSRRFQPSFKALTSFSAIS